MNERRVIVSLIIPEICDIKIPITKKPTAQQKTQTNTKNTITLMCEKKKYSDLQLMIISFTKRERNDLLIF